MDRAGRAREVGDVRPPAIEHELDELGRRTGRSRPRQFLPRGTRKRLRARIVWGFCYAPECDR